MKEDILKLLDANNRKEDGIYIPQELDNYVNKLIKNSRIIAVQENGEFQGFISYYKNDPENKLGYLSMLLINKESQSYGTGSFLLKTAIEDLKKELFSVFQLEVLKTNVKAINLYRKFGFKVIKENGDLLLMELELKSDD